MGFESLVTHEAKVRKLEIAANVTDSHPLKARNLSNDPSKWVFFFHLLKEMEPVYGNFTKPKRAVLTYPVLENVKTCKYNLLRLL